MNWYYIALSSEIDRIAKIELWLQELFGSHYWIPGKTGADDRVGRYQNHRRIKRFGFPMVGAEIGCFLSHRECWERVAESGAPGVILESDAIPKSLNSLRETLSFLEAPNVLKQYDLVRLSGVFPHNEKFPRTLGSFGGHSLVQCIGDPMGSAAYLITPFAARSLLTFSEVFFVPVDVYLGMTWLHRLRVRSIHPYPMTTIESESVIGDRRRPKQTRLQRLKIELNRAADDIRRVLYLPFHYWR